MEGKRPRKYFIVKHDLQSFEALPGVIWRVDVDPSLPPHNFKLVQPGDYWVEFAYVTDEVKYDPCSLIMGFFECTAVAKHGELPPGRKTAKWDSSSPGSGWFIEGKPLEPMLAHAPVAVPSIDQILKRRVFGRGAIIPGLTFSDFELLRNDASRRQLNPANIPLFGRQPVNEQEVLAIVIAGRDALGIDKVIRVQAAFPDTLLQIGDKEVYMELEFDSLNFWIHGHPSQLRQCPDGPEPMLPAGDDKTPVGVLCWVDGAAYSSCSPPIAGLRVFELQTLVRENKKIQW